MSVLLVNTGLCNIGSVKRAVEECGNNCLIADDPSLITTASHVIIPGVGSFGDASSILKNKGWIDTLQEYVGQKKLPLLGICLGMQLLLSEGHEHGVNEGLNLIPGKAVKMRDNTLRMPHVGWNEIIPRTDNPLLKDVPAGTDFYFVHSYHALPDNPEHILATVPYGKNYAAAIGKGNVWGTQFHPEKSGLSGFKILENFLNHA
jgi:glutamine amidotransferase